MNRWGLNVLVLALLAILTAHCGGEESCENPNPNHDPADPSSVVCLDGAGAGSLVAENTGDEESASEAASEESTSEAASEESTSEESTEERIKEEESSQSETESSAESSAENASSSESVAENMEPESDPDYYEEYGECGTEEGDYGDDEDAPDFKCLGEDKWINGGDVCDGEDDCEGGQDELDCFKTQPELCPESDLSGLYDVQLTISLAEGPLTVQMEIAQTEDKNCYGGNVISPSTGEVVASVTRVVQAGDSLKLTFTDFQILPEQTGLLPDGGMANIFLTTTQWDDSSTLCGDLIYKLTEPFLTADVGTFAAVSASSGIELPEDMGYECSMIPEAEDPEEDVEGAAGGDPEEGDPAENDAEGAAGGDPEEGDPAENDAEGDAGGDPEEGDPAADDVEGDAGGDPEEGDPAADDAEGDAGGDSEESDPAENDAEGDAEGEPSENDAEGDAGGEPEETDPAEDDAEA